MKYEVPIVYKGQATFIVEAETPEAAEDLATERWMAGEKGDLPSSDYDSIENIGQISEVSSCA